MRGLDASVSSTPKRPGMLVIISGPSGSGKGTVVKSLTDSQYALSISVTTRPKRPGEVDGADYFFRTEEEFFKMREQNEFLEHEVYVGRYYGTPRKYVESQIEQGKVVVLEIEVNGALRVKQMFPDAVLVFIIPPSLNELARRLAFRNTEEIAEIEDRMHRALEEIQLIELYDYLVINEDLSKVVQEIDTIVSAEGMKPHRRKASIDKFILAR